MDVKPLSVLQEEGWVALVEKLGPIDALRFIQIYDTGGDLIEDDLLSPG